MSFVLDLAEKMSNKRRSKNQRDMRRIIQIKQEQKDGSLT
jgi:hypothetical protein